MPTTSYRDIYARWGYSEIGSPYSAPRYATAPRIEHLRKAHAAGVPFADLSKADREHLAYICGLVRAPLAEFTKGIRNFEETAVVKATLGAFKVPRILSQRPPMPFADFIRATSTAASDFRTIMANGGYTSPPDPLIVGRADGELVLIDGYHRAALFWKFAEPARTIQAYLPVD